MTSVKARPVAVYSSNATPLFEAVDRVRRAMRNGVYTRDFYVLDAQGHTPTGDGYRSWVSAFYIFERERIAMRFMASRDVGHHSSGWFKNPDYERCEHLSLSCWDADKDDAPIPFDRTLTTNVVDAFFGQASRLVWEEGPKHAAGKRTDTHHFRVFCDASWQPILPRGEVYSRELTEAGWLSWSDRKADQASGADRT